MLLQVIQKTRSSKRDTWSEDMEKIIEKDRKNMLSELASKEKDL